MALRKCHGTAWAYVFVYVEKKIYFIFIVVRLIFDPLVVAVMVVANTGRVVQGVEVVILN